MFSAKGKMNGKLKLGLYWAASCGGCDIAILELREKILDLDAAADILFWPVAVDFKYKDIEAMPDGHIDVCLFNGAIRTADVRNRRCWSLLDLAPTRAASRAWAISSTGSPSLSAST